MYTVRHWLLGVGVLAGCSIATTLPIDALAQKGWNVSFRAGYGIPFVTDDMGSPVPEVGPSDFYSNSLLYKASDKSIFSTSGGGAQGTVGVSYMLSDKVGFEVGFTYVNGPRTLDARMERTYRAFSSIQGDSVTVSYRAEQYSTSRGYSVAPTVVLSTGTATPWVGYMRLGALVPLGGTINSTLRVNDQGTGLVAQRVLGLSDAPVGTVTTLDADVVTTSRPSYGFVSAGGLRYMKGRWSVFAEANMVMLTIQPKQTRFERYEHNTLIPIVPGINLEQTELFGATTEINYQTELTQSSNNRSTNPRGFDINKPSDERSFKQSFNQIAFYLGVAYHF